MIQLLVQSDDYGITPGVSAGIREGIQNGIIRNTGIFINMPCSYQAAQDIKNMDVCLGIDINYVCGKPVSDPKLIPHLVDENGDFYKSTDISQKHKIVSYENLITTFEIDPYPYHEIYLETENQVKRFIEIIGRLPEYIHPHSLLTPNTYKAAQKIAQKYGIYHSMDLMLHYPCLPTTFMGTKGSNLQDQIDIDITKHLLEDDLPVLKNNQTYYYIGHCGYIDYQLFEETTLTLRRIKDLHAMLDKDIISYIHNHDIKLITYKNLK